MAEKDRLVTIDRAAEISGLNRDEIKQRIRIGAISTAEIDNIVFVRLREVMDFAPGGPTTGPDFEQKG